VTLLCSWCRPCPFISAVHAFGLSGSCPWVTNAFSLTHHRLRRAHRLWIMTTNVGGLNIASCFHCQRLEKKSQQKSNVRTVVPLIQSIGKKALMTSCGNAYGLYAKSVSSRFLCDFLFGPDVRHRIAQGPPTKQKAHSV
jgi:hypothetical protein